MVYATQLRTGRTGEMDLVEVHGGLDIATTPRLRTVLLGRLAGGARRLVVDLSRADMIDCTAIGSSYSYVTAPSGVAGRCAPSAPTASCCGYSR